jgi:phosphatidylglycerol:prolipoprotein diacylglycerol transferase
MLDIHEVPFPSWGVRPILFEVGNFQISSYSFFVSLGILVGLLFYWLYIKNEKNKSNDSFYVIISALIGGAIGAKLPLIFIYWKEIFFAENGISILIYGKTILGALIGGTLGVLFIKNKLKIKSKFGNFIAPSIALGVAIGRIGCFLRGCCYGKETSLPWGVNFGDGIFRHPTQIYESIFMLGMFFFLIYKKKKNPAPGSLFKILIIAYFSFRFLIEFIRIEQVAFLGLTYFQYICLLCISWFLIKK